jgi:hypothetical protein
MFEQDNPCCVLCGKELTEEQTEYFHENGIAPGCPDHFDQVQLEAHTGHSMWPSNWYGHWLISDPDVEELTRSDYTEI